MSSRLFAGIATVATLLVSSSSGFASQHARTSFQRAQVTELPVFRQHYDVRLFASGTARVFNPDSIVAVGKYLYVGYQNATQPDGSDGGDSTIVEYNRSGATLHVVNVKGRCDGLRYNPYTHLLWATANEDANPHLYTMTTSLGNVRRYTFSAEPHGGGYDDIAFTNGNAFVAASNPALNAAGVNVHPAVDQVTLRGSVAQITPVLYGNATATDLTTHTQVTLNEIDPDSMTLDPQGDVVLVNQAGSELVFIANAGTAKQVVSRIPVGTQLDDTVFAKTSASSLFVVDSKANKVYVVRADRFVPGTVYTEAPADSGVASFVGTLDLSTGIITPAIPGFGSPSGLLFVPDVLESD